MMNRAYRLTVASALGVTLLTGGATAAVAAPLGTTQMASASAPQRATLTAKASVNSAKAWQEFRITGTSTGLKPGTKVTLQGKQGAKWVSTPASVSVGKNGVYALRAKWGIKGKNELRVVGGGAVSPAFVVTVR